MSNEGREEGDRTGLPAEHVYQLGTDHGTRWSVHSREDGTPVCVSCLLGTPCPTDPATVEVCHARDGDGRCAIWGVDAGGRTLWFRDDDAIARAAVGNVYAVAGL